MHPSDPAALHLETTWAPRFQSLIETRTHPDAAHDLQHLHRVLATARRLCASEGADWLIVFPAAWLHDCVTVPKDSPHRAQASQLAAQEALRWLAELGWPHGGEASIAHAIETHSFSARLPPQTLEARVLQDADRLDALGAIGLARVLQVSASLGRPLYHPDDPFWNHRPADDRAFAIDHFPLKLLTLEHTMLTAAGRSEAHRRSAFLQQFLDQLRSEISP